jgi:hypothetical protein
MSPASLIHFFCKPIALYRVFLYIFPKHGSFTAQENPIHRRDRLFYCTEENDVRNPCMTEVFIVLTGLVTFHVETAFYNRLLRKDKRRYRSDRKTRKKT